MKSSKPNNTISTVERINRKRWWHKPPLEENAYKKRGMFLASTFKNCEFYGRPLDVPIRVNIKNPLIGTDMDLIKPLFGDDSPQMQAVRYLTNTTSKDWVKVRFKLDADIARAAKIKGYDAVVYVLENGMERIRQNMLPRDIELNVLYSHCQNLPVSF